MLLIEKEGTGTISTFFKFFNFNIRTTFLELFLVRPVLDHKVFEQYATSENLVHELALHKTKLKKENKASQLGFKDKIV